MIDSLEKLEIVKDRGEAAQILGGLLLAAALLRLSASDGAGRRRNAFELFLEYSTFQSSIFFLQKICYNVINVW